MDKKAKSLYSSIDNRIVAVRATIEERQLGAMLSRELHTQGGAADDVDGFGQEQWDDGHEDAVH